MRKWCCVIALAGAVFAPVRGLAAPAGAANEKAPVPAAPARLVLPSPERLVRLAAAPDDEALAAQRSADRDPRRAVLSSLHAVTGLVQAYDGMLTMRVLNAGGRETNPLMKPVTGSEGAMLGVKVAAALATVIGTETLWRDNHRVAAILTSIIANSGMAMVARHNARVLAAIEGR